MQCFCGCERKVAFGKREMNKRGVRIRGDIETARGVMSLGVQSPTGEMFMRHGEILLSVLAEAVHAGVNPGPEFERETRRFMAFGRNFTPTAIGGAIRRSGLSAEDTSVMMRNGEFDPWAGLQIPT